MKKTSSRKHIKDHFAESRLFINRVIWTILFMAGLLTVTFSRLYYLQVQNHSHFSTLSHENRVKLTAIEPTRGLIYDRNGVILAENLPSFRLEITPEQVGDMDALLAELQQIVDISEDDLHRFRRNLKNKHPFDDIPLRFLLTDEEVAKIAAINHRLDGLHISAGLSRHYPQGAVVGHVVGYVGRIDEKELQKLDTTNYRGTSHIGKIGIEKRYENELHGQVGYQQVETNARGRILRVLERTPPVPGDDLHLSIDIELQRTADDALGDASGALVAIDPNNGEVLALVSKPTYDPNAFVNGIDALSYGILRDNKSQPLFNRALLGQYPPGSTLKPMIGLAGLHYAATDEHLNLFCPGFYRLPGEDRKFRDWKRSGHGDMDLDQAITQSCDVYFYDLARNLGIDRMAPFLRGFGLGAKTGIDMHVERDGLIPSREWKNRTRRQAWFPGETLNTGIGQGYVLTTPIQLAQATAIMATRGHRAKPRMTKTTQAEHLPSEILRPLTGVDDEDWNYILKAMIHVVEHPRGTARRIANRQYRIAGKTGTAQVFGIKQEEEYDEEKVAAELRDHALFIAFAPVKDPKIAVAVIVENGGSGGSVAAPIVGKVIEQYLAGKDL